MKVPAVAIRNEQFLSKNVLLVQSTESVVVKNAPAIVVSLFIRVTSPVLITPASDRASPSVSQPSDITHLVLYHDAIS